MLVFLLMYSRSKLAEKRSLSHVAGALPVSVTHVLLHARGLVGPQGPHVGLRHGNSGNGRVADGVLFADVTGRDRPVRERGLQGVQQVHHDADELQRSPSLFHPQHFTSDLTAIVKFLRSRFGTYLPGLFGQHVDLVRIVRAHDGR